MSLVVTQRPSISYEGDVSTWNSVRNPVIYKMIRKDYVFNQINNNGGFIQVQFNGVDITANMVVGQTVSLISDNGVYDRSGEITASAFSGGNTLVTIDSGYLSAAPGGFANNHTTRLLYKVEVDLYDLSSTLINAAPFYYTPSTKGYLLIDVAPILRAQLIADFDGDLTGSTQVFDDTSIYQGFYIKYREVWTGSSELQTNDTTANSFYATLSARQIPAANGGNLAEYVVPEIEFLTKLDTLVMWRGYPTILSAIINEGIGADIFLTSDQGDSTPADHSGQQVAFDLNQILTDQTVSESEVAIYREGSGGLMSELLPIELRDPCDNPIFLQGRNSLGGIIQWMFDENQEYTFDYGDGLKAKRLRLFADDLTLNQWEALQDFFTLGEVYRNNIRELTSSTIKTSSRNDNQVYVIGADGSKIGVLVIPRQPSTETRQVKHIFEIEIEYPELF